jgi:hypothetical protein
VESGHASLGVQGKIVEQTAVVSEEIEETLSVQARKPSRDLVGRVGVSVDDMVATTSHLTPAVSHGQQDVVMRMEGMI